MSEITLIIITTISWTYYWISNW